jgi:2-hydroxy-3-keto-5-methylthiopentenyl-1-phosphate phosphatase
MTLSDNQEQFFRSFFARQKDISKQALIATATMAQANMEMILTAGLNNIYPKIMSEVKEDVNIQGQLKEIKEGIKANQQDIEEIKLAQNSMRDINGQA